MKLWPLLLLVPTLALAQYRPLGINPAGQLDGTPAGTAANWHNITTNAGGGTIYIWGMSNGLWVIIPPVGGGGGFTNWVATGWGLTNSALPDAGSNTLSVSTNDLNLIYAHWDITNGLGLLWRADITTLSNSVWAMSWVTQAVTNGLNLQWQADDTTLSNSVWAAFWTAASQTVFSNWTAATYWTLGNQTTYSNFVDSTYAKPGITNGLAQASLYVPYTGMTTDVDFGGRGATNVGTVHGTNGVFMGDVTIYGNSLLLGGSWYPTFGIRKGATVFGYFGSAGALFGGCAETDLGIYGNGHDIYIGAGSSPALKITTAGKVGIGTPVAGVAFPNSTLHVTDPAQYAPSVTTNAPTAVQFLSGGIELAGACDTVSPWAFWLQSRYNNIGWPLALNPLGGSVGIATNAPGSTLDVNGTFNVQSNATMKASLTVDGTLRANGGYLASDGSAGVTITNIVDAGGVVNARTNIYRNGLLVSSTP